MKKIHLTQGKVALVDDDMFEYLNQWKWHAFKGHNTIYAARSIIKDGKKQHIFMHRDILNASLDSLVDHKDRNGLHNLRDNLRHCTDTQNKTNAKLRKDSTTGYKGVTYYQNRKKFRSYINFKNKQVSLGYFSASTDAALAYNQAAIQYFGEFARVNEI